MTDTLTSRPAFDGQSSSLTPVSRTYAHRCNSLCMPGGIHAIPCLHVLPNASPASLQWAYDRHQLHLELLALRPVHEVDLTQYPWVRRPEEWTTYTPEATYPYIAYVRAAPGYAPGKEGA